MSILGVQGVKRLKTNLCLGENQFYVAVVIFILRFRHCLGNLHKQIKLRLINYSFANVTTAGVSRFSPRKTLWSYLKKGTLLTQRRKLVTDCWRTSVGAQSDFSHIPTSCISLGIRFKLLMQNSSNPSFFTHSIQASVVADVPCTSILSECPL